MGADAERWSALYLGGLLAFAAAAFDTDTLSFSDPLLSMPEMTIVLPGSQSCCAFALALPSRPYTSGILAHRVLMPVACLSLADDFQLQVLDRGAFLHGRVRHHQVIRTRDGIRCNRE